MRVTTVCGTRPELIKLSPLVVRLDGRFDHHYLFTGQHYSPNMVQVFVDELHSVAPDRFLDVGSSDVQQLTAATQQALADAEPDLVLVYGDTNSTVAASRAAQALGVPLIHLEAGIRSFDQSMPEERNRIEADRLARLRLAPSGLAQWFLCGLEGWPRLSCPVVGNLGIDALKRHLPMAAERPLPAGLLAAEDSFCLLTVHRQATVDDPSVMARLLTELALVPLLVWVPLHPRTAARVASFGLSWPANVRVDPAVGYLSFLRALSEAAVVLTDSGGVQEEAISLGVPCVTLRPNTERMETVFAGANRLFDPVSAMGLAERVQEALAAGATPDDRCYGGGHSASRVVAILDWLSGGQPSELPIEEQGMSDADTLRAAAAAFHEGPGEDE